MPIQLDMITKLTATAIFAGAVAILATVVIERLGGKLGGILATIPTTIVPASFGFWFLSSQPTEFENALWSVPAGMLLNAAFLHSWHWMPQMITVTHRWLKLCLIVTCSLSLWMVLAFTSVLILERLIDFMPIVGFSTLLIQVVYGCFASRSHRPAIKGKRQVGVIALLARGVMAATAIAAASLIIALGHPVLAGVASVFPAIFLTIMVSVWISQGEGFPATAVGPMMLGSTSVGAFALISIWSFPTLGPTLGSLIAWCLSLAFVSFPCAKLLQARQAGTHR